MANIGGVYFWTQKDFNTLMQTLSDIQHKLVNLQASVTKIQAQEDKTMAALDDLTAQVTANTNLEQSAVTLIEGIAAQLQTALNNNDTPALQALTQHLSNSAAALGAAITANTPATPTPAPDPNAPTPTPQAASAHHGR